MKPALTVIGILMIVVGIVTLAYQRITYTKHENVAQIGDIRVTADTPTTIYFPPVFGGLTLVAGIVLVVISRKN